MLATGRKESLSATKGTEIEVTHEEYEVSTGNVWYRAILEENLGKSKRKKLSVRHLKPLVEEDYTPPLIKTGFHRLIRPIPPPTQDLFPGKVDFEEGDVIDAAYKGAWWSGEVIKVLENQRYLVYLRFEPDVIEIDRNELRPHLVWKNEEWFRCEKRELVETDFSVGKNVEVKIDDEQLGEVWAPGIAIKQNMEEDTLTVKYKSSSSSSSDEDYEYVKISFPYSKIRPSPPPVGLRDYNLMEKVDAFLEPGWCSGKVSRVLSGNKYAVDLVINNEKIQKKCLEFNDSELRPSMEWKDGVWVNEPQAMETEEESTHAAEETTTPPSSRIRVSVRSGLKDYKALNSGKSPRATRSSSSSGGVTTPQNPSPLPLPPPPVSSNGGDVSVKASETTITGELGSNKMVVDDTVMMNGNSKVTNTPEKLRKVPSSPMVVLGLTSSSVTKLTIQKTQGKTSPRKKLQPMKNQKGSANETVIEKPSEEPKTRESVNKRKRGRQPRKFISSEPKQKIASNGSKVTAITQLTDMTDDDKPLASWILGSSNNGIRQQQQSVTRTPESVKHMDVVETPKEDSSSIVLPFAKKSPLWKVIESMEIFKSVPPQRPHFSPLLSTEEEFREGDAIGAMVMFTGLLDKLNNLQVDDSISSIKRLNECFNEMEKHGFDIESAKSRIKKLIEIKETQGWVMEEMKVVEREITEKESKKKKIDDDVDEIKKKIVELQREEMVMRDSRVLVEKEIERMMSHVTVLDQKVQSVEMEFRATVAAPLR